MRAGAVRGLDRQHSGHVQARDRVSTEMPRCAGGFAPPVQSRAGGTCVCVVGGCSATRRGFAPLVGLRSAVLVRFASQARDMLGTPKQRGVSIVGSRAVTLKCSRAVDSVSHRAHPTAPVLGSSRQFWAWIGHLQPSVDVDLRSKASLPLAASEGVRQTLGLRL
jgi:hypothetical protein